MRSIGPCVCSPRQFGFRLDLSAVCPQLPPPFPPNDVFGAGIQNYYRAISYEPTGMVDTEEELMDSTTSSTTAPSRSFRRRMQDGIFHPYNSTVANSEALPPTEVGFVSINNCVGEDLTPIVIDSIQIIEFDLSMTPLQLDSNYIDVNFHNGDVFSYTSFSEQNQNPYLLIESISMVLHGRNAAGGAIRNGFTVTYTNDCGIPTFQDGDAIGWVVFVSSLVLCFTSLIICTTFSNASYGC